MKTITIGRSSHCDIIIPHNSVSREHARISIIGGQYVYEDLGKNGSVIGGRIIQGERLAIAAGTEILLAGQVPLPWAQVYAMLPLRGARPFEDETHYEPPRGGKAYDRQYENYGAVTPKEDSLGVGYAILAFLFPIIGWIMYFVWKDDHPRKASQASTAAWIGFVIHFITILSSM